MLGSSNWMPTPPLINHQIVEPFPCIDVVADGVILASTYDLLAASVGLTGKLVNVIKLPLGITIFPDIVPPASCKYRASKEPKFGDNF